MITPEERARRERAHRDALASLRLEGMYLEEDELAIYQQYVRGEISEDERHAALAECRRRRFGPLPVSGNADA